MNITIFSERGTSTEQVSDLPTLLARPEVTIWVDITGPGPEDVKVMENIFHFHHKNI